MAISEFEQKRCDREMENFLKAHRPPAHIRHEFDIGYRLENQSVEIFEVRPHFRNPKETMETMAAKATYVKAQNEWRVFWFKSDMKWHRYPPAPEVKYFEDFFAIVGEDANSCFWS